MLIRAFVAAIVVVTLSSAARAAYLELTDEQKHETAPLEESLPPCSASATLTQASVFGPLNQSAMVTQTTKSEVEGTDPTCVLTLATAAGFFLTFTIQPDAGENVGDPINICVQHAVTLEALA